MTVDFLTINRKNEVDSQLNLTSSNFSNFANKVITALEVSLAEAIDARDEADERVYENPGDPGYLDWAERNAAAANDAVLSLQTCLWAWRRLNKGEEMPIFDVICNLPDVMTSESVSLYERERYYVTSLLKNLTTILHYQGNVMVYVA